MHFKQLPQEPLLITKEIDSIKTNFLQKREGWQIKNSINTKRNKNSLI